jgi:hypothetical protein
VSWRRYGDRPGRAQSDRLGGRVEICALGISLEKQYDAVVVLIEDIGRNQRALPSADARISLNDDTHLHSSVRLNSSIQIATVVWSKSR